MRRKLRKDYTGFKKGRLEFLEPFDCDKWCCTRWLAVCDCGNLVITYPKHEGSSCGCYNQELREERATTRRKEINDLYPREYNSWQSMKRRCLTPTSQSYKHYGARGIKVCDRWMYSFENFLADMGSRPKKMSLERINNDGNYEPSNCKWATTFEQGNNKSWNVFYEYKGKKLTVSQWARYFKVKIPTFYGRIRRHSFEEAIKRSTRKPNV